MRCRLRVDEGHGHSTAEQSEQVDSHFACSQVRMRKYLDYRRVSCHLVSGRYMYENETKLCWWTLTFYIAIPMWWPCIAISISHEFFGSFYIMGQGFAWCSIKHWYQPISQKNLPKIQKWCVIPQKLSTGIDGGSFPASYLCCKRVPSLLGWIWPFSFSTPHLRTSHFCWTLFPLGNSIPWCNSWALNVCGPHARPQNGVAACTGPTIPS